MKNVTASEARRNWFKLLDEAARGEIITIQRNGKKLILRLEKRRRSVPSYRGMIRGADIENADKWGWEWSDSKGFVPVTR